MNYEKYEEIIVERLKMPGVEVKTLPHESLVSSELSTNVPTIYVILNGATFGDGKNLSLVTQQETVNGKLSIRAKERHGELGVFDLYEKACSRLLGFRLPEAKECITLGQFEYVSDIQDKWEYSVSFSFTKVRVQENEIKDIQLITGINNQFKI